MTLSYENIWLVSCDGLDDSHTGENHHLNFETGAGAVWADDENIDDVARKLSAEQGIISVEPNRSISREALFDLMIDPGDGMTLVSVSGHDLTDDGVVQLTRKNLTSVSIPMSVVRSAEFEFDVENGTGTIRYAHGRFSTNSKTGLRILAERIAPLFV